MTYKQIIIYKKECYNEPYCSLNQVLEQLEAYKMEAEEGKEINAELKAELTRANCQIADDEILQCDMREAIEELKAENEEYKKANDCILTTLNVIAEGNKKLRQTLTEIKELCKRQDLNQGSRCIHILQKISEVEDA